MSLIPNQSMITYGNFYRQILWPLYEQLCGRHTYHNWSVAERNQWLSLRELEQLQTNELRKLLIHAGDQSQWYAARFKSVGLDVHTQQLPANFLRLPPITKDDINANRDAMLAQNFRGKVHKHRTGGSTGTPLRFYLNHGSYEWRVAVSMRGYAWAGCRDGDRQFYVWGAPIGTPPWMQGLKTSLHNAILARRVFSSFSFSRTAMSRCINEIQKFRPLTIIGYTNALFLLAQHASENKLTIPSPRAIITAAEGVNALQREIIEKVFGAPVFASYGSREFMLIGMECDRHNGFHLSADNLLVEVLRPDGARAADGEIGEIVITDLHNFGMPFIRYKIGDLGMTSKRACSCGRGLPLLQSVEGRILDAIRTPDGRIVPGEFFPHLIKEFDAVRQFQVIQKRLDWLQINLVLNRQDTTQQLEQLEQEVHRTLGNNIRVDIAQVQEIPGTASGKFRVSISEI